jgi:glycosyltransferase involved in cell wall biosynthesis
MTPRAPRIHLELGPVLVNRTAVYQMCRAAPRELTARGFAVTASALTARVGLDAEPETPRERRRFDWSLRWLRRAAKNPTWFLKTRRLLGLLPRLRHARGTSVFFDPLYPLFFAGLDRGVVLAYDTSPATDFDWHPPGVGDLYQAAFRFVARSRFHVVCSSRNTSDHLRANWGIAPSRLTVLPLAAFPSAMPEVPAGKYPDAPFLLFVGSLDSRKNVVGLARAYHKSGLLASHGLRLRMIGYSHSDCHPIRQILDKIPGVDVAGFTSAGEITAAYRDCFAFVYPSLLEGFGLPLLEAMHHGCLCLSTICGASPEVSGDAALYVNPYDFSDVVRGLRRLVELPAGERLRLQEAARRRAAVFSWTRFYDGLADVLRRVAAEDAGRRRMTAIA